MATIFKTRPEKTTAGPRQADTGTSFTLTLDKNKAPDDGKSTITATAHYKLDGQWASGANVTFQLQEAPNAKFTDNQQQQTNGNCDPFGQVPKSFTDTAAESGYVYAFVTGNPDLHDSQPFQFTSTISDDWTVDLDLQNNGAVDDGKTQITAVATVKNGGVPQANQTVTFTVNGSALFTNNRQSITANTNSSGVATAKFTDTTAETGLATASISLPNDENPSATQPYFFYGPPDFAINLNLSNNPAQANGTDRITATATLTAQTPGANVANEPVQFQLMGKVSAQFIDPTTGKTTTDNPITVNTNSGGVSNVQFVDSEWEGGTIEAFLQDSEDNEIFATQPYTFDPPSDLAVAVVLKTEATDGTGTTVVLNSCPADGEAKLTVVASVAEGQNAWTKGGNVTFTLTDTSGGNSIHAAFTNGLASITVPLQSDGTAQAKFLDSYIENGTVTAQVDVPDNKGPSNSQNFSFIDPWTSATDVNAVLPSGRSFVIIYANGLSQAKVILTIDLASFNNVDLKDSNSPSIDSVIAKTTIVNFSTKNEITSPWAYSTTDNGYLPTPDTGFTPRASRRRQKDANGVTDGVATIAYFITNDSHSGGTIITVGAKIQPTGQIIYATGDKAADGTPIGGLKAADPVYFATGSTFNHSPPAVSLRQDVPYVDGSLKITGMVVNHADTSDTQPVMKEGNFWRQWDHTIMVDQSRPQRAGCIIKNCLLDSGTPLPADYAFGEMSNVLYDYKAYFWPNNVSDSKGNPLPRQSSYQIQSAGAGPYTIGVQAGPGTLKATLFCAFGNVSVGSFNFVPIGMTVIDQFGNSGRFVLNIDPSQFPQTYDTANTLPNWKVLTARAQGLPSGGNQQGTYGGVKLTCQDTADGHNNAHPWTGPNTVTQHTGGPLLQLDSGGAATYTATPVDASKSNISKTYNITQSAGTYLKLGTNDTGNQNDYWVVSGGSATAWSFAPIWQGGTLIVSNNMLTSSPPCWRKQDIVEDGNTYYYGVLTDPTSIIGLDSKFVWKFTS
jgi:hypothetical protein